MRLCPAAGTQHTSRGGRTIPTQIIEQALACLGVPVFHGSVGEGEAPYLVWSETGQAGGLWADDKQECQVLQGTADYVTQLENDPNGVKLQEVLNNGEIFWKLESLQREQSGCIRWRVTWKIPV